MVGGSYGAVVYSSAEATLYVRDTSAAISSLAETTVLTNAASACSARGAPALCGAGGVRGPLLLLRAGVDAVDAVLRVLRGGHAHGGGRLRQHPPGNNEPCSIETIRTIV